MPGRDVRNISVKIETEQMAKSGKHSGSGGRGAGGEGPGGGRGVNLRNMHTKVKTARGRKISSTLWLQRQLNDPYVQKAKAEGYASRAAYKLLEIDERYGLLKPCLLYTSPSPRD